MEQPAQANGHRAPSDDYAELRQLLLGPEREQLDRLDRRATDPAQRARDLSEVLPHAIRLSADQNPALRASLQPLIEEAIRNSVRRNPELLADALFPIIGAAVRKAVASALKSVMDSMNQAMEQSFSLRSLQWRLEAARTGRPYSEILLTRSLLYRVEQVFLIHKQTGLLLQQRSSEGAVVRDADLVSGMLTAIQDFVSDSFGGQPGQELETLRVGDLDVWIQHGPRAILAAVIRGTPPRALESVFAHALEQISLKKGAELEQFRGDAQPFAVCQEDLKTCFLGQARPAEPTRRWRKLIWTAAGLALAAFLLGVYLGSADNRRWNRYVETLRGQPGVIVTAVERRGGVFYLTGLRDPLAVEPEALLKGSGLDRTKVQFHWEPFHSLQPSFETTRRIATEQQFLEAQVIHFSAQEIRLTPGETAGVEQLARHIASLRESVGQISSDLKIEIVGHSDDQGPDDVNLKLSFERAEEVRLALVAAGVPETLLTTRGVGKKEPLKPGTADSTRAFNRGVTVRVQVISR